MHGSVSACGTTTYDTLPSDPAYNPDSYTEIEAWLLACPSPLTAEQRLNIHIEITKNQSTEGGAGTGGP